MRFASRHAPKLSVWVACATGVALLLAPQLADACAVCFSGTDDTRQAFTATTVFLTALPLVMVGSTVGWLLHQLRR